MGDAEAFGGSGGIIRVNPLSGAQTTVSSGGFSFPMGLATAANGDIIVADEYAGVIRVNPLTGTQTPVNGFHSLGIAIAPNGDIYVAGLDYFGPGAVVRLNPLTGVLTTVSSGGLLMRPYGIAIEAGGDILVADPLAFGIVGGIWVGGIIRINPLTGAQSVVASGGILRSPTGIAIAGNGDILVADAGALASGAVVRVDPLTGAQTTVSTGGTLNTPLGIALDANGELLVTTHPLSIASRAVIRVNPLTGAQTTVSSGGSFYSPVGIAIVPELGPITSNVVALPNPVAVGASFQLTANVNDSATGCTNIALAEHTVDGSSFIAMSSSDGAFDGVREDVTATVPPFAAAGLRSVCVRGTDAAGKVGASECAVLVVYDPEAGSVSGGGSVFSPPDAYQLPLPQPVPSPSGPATFAFLSRYVPGHNTPSGHLEFQFRAGNLRFSSASMEWLVVTGEPRAIFRGEGTLDWSWRGSFACKFEVDAWDGSFQPGGVDAFGLRIHSCAGVGNAYNLPATSLTTGNIIIHK